MLLAADGVVVPFFLLGRGNRRRNVRCRYHWYSLICCTVRTTGPIAPSIFPCEGSAVTCFLGFDEVSTAILLSVRLPWSALNRPFLWAGYRNCRQVEAQKIRPSVDYCGHGRGER